MSLSAYNYDSGRVIHVEHLAPSPCKKQVNVTNQRPNCCPDALDAETAILD